MRALVAPAFPLRLYAELASSQDAGATLTEREGSRVKFALQGVEWHAHRPHPGKEARKYQVESAREFLDRLEIRP